MYVKIMFIKLFIMKSRKYYVSKKKFKIQNKTWYVKDSIYHLRNDFIPGLAKLGFSRNVSNRWNRYVLQVYLWCLTVFVLKVENMRQADVFSDLAQ
jgi:hypothetical protein